MCKETERNQGVNAMLEDRIRELKRRKKAVVSNAKENIWLSIEIQLNFAVKIVNNLKEGIFDQELEVNFQ